AVEESACKLANGAGRTRECGVLPSVAQNLQRGATRLDQLADQGARSEAHSDLGVAYALHGTAIYNYVRRMMANEADAEDLTLAAFEKALRAWSRRPPDGELRPWLF